MFRNQQSEVVAGVKIFRNISILANTGQCENPKNELNGHGQGFGNLVSTTNNNTTHHHHLSRILQHRLVPGVRNTKQRELNQQRQTE